jgi:hypothetical protein
MAGLWPIFLLTVIGFVTFVASQFAYRAGETQGTQVKLREWHQTSREHRQAAEGLWQEIEKSPILPPQDFSKD